MEPELLTWSRPCNPQPESVEFQQGNTEFCEENITYTDFRVKYSSNIQKKKMMRILRTKESWWCMAAIIFAFLYLIALAAAAVMTAKVICLEDFLNTMELTNYTAQCKAV